MTPSSDPAKQAKLDERMANLTLASIYPLYLNRLEKNGRTEEELLKVIRWLTGLTKAQVKSHIKKESTYREFFAAAKMNPKAKLIKGMVCGYRVEEIKNPLIRKARYMEKLIDELARGKKMESILRS